MWFVRLRRNLMASKKHKELTFATRNVPGYNTPTAPKSKAGGGYPSHQPFFKQTVKRK
jgi:hypothetical protein